AGMRTSVTQFLHIGLEGLDALRHAHLGILFYVVEHGIAPENFDGYSNVTVVPTSSPFTMRVRSPELLRLNTRKGKRLSRHMTMAVASMTLSFSVSTRSKLRRG